VAARERGTAVRAPRRAGGRRVSLEVGLVWVAVARVACTASVLRPPADAAARVAGDDAHLLARVPQMHRLDRAERAALAQQRRLIGHVDRRLLAAGGRRRRAAGRRRLGRLRRRPPLGDKPVLDVPHVDNAVLSRGEQPALDRAAAPATRRRVFQQGRGKDYGSGPCGGTAGSSARGRNGAASAAGRRAPAIQGRWQGVVRRGHAKGW